MKRPLGVKGERPQPRSGEDVRPGRRVAVGEARGCRAELISLSAFLGKDQADGSPCGSLRWRNSVRDRQAARDDVAPAGAKLVLVDSMCQMASVSLRATSTRAILAPRCLPSRVLV